MRPNISKRRFRGFTLVELIVVITILAILATVGFLALSGYTQDAKDSAIKANVRSLQTAITSEAAVTNNSPRHYVAHDTDYALSWAFAYVDGASVALTGGDVGSAPLDSNYTAGKPDFKKLKLNPEKFRISASGLPGGTLGIVAGATGFGAGSFGPDFAEASYDAGSLMAAGADFTTTWSNGKKRVVSYVQAAGLSPATKLASVAGNFPTTGTPAGYVSWLLRAEPGSATNLTGSLLDGAAGNGTVDTSNLVWSSCPSWAVCSGRIASFSTKGSFSVQIPADGSYEILVVGGGGGGGSWFWGGWAGGAGGYANKTTATLVAGQSYSVTVWAGGLAGPSSSTDGYGTTGWASSVWALVSANGGGGWASGGTQGNVQSTLTNTAGGTCGGKSWGGYDSSSTKAAGCDGTAYYSTFDATVTHGAGWLPTNNYGAESDAGGGGGGGFGNVAKTVACPNGGTAATGHWAGGSGVGSDDYNIACQVGADGYVRIKKL